MDEEAKWTLLSGAFFPHLGRARDQLKQSQRQLIYYTGAATADMILANRELWMRNTRVMNDVSEVEHGIECLRRALHPDRTSFVAALNEVHAGLGDRVWQQLQENFATIYQQTYILCLSEHDPDADPLGRLSMWRAYGGSAGVALVLPKEVLFQRTRALAAYSSPVAYLDDAGVLQMAREIAANVSERADALRGIDVDELAGYVFNALRFATVSIKHPAFREEREWRVVASPLHETVDHMRPVIANIGGIPQQVIKLPLKDRPQEGLNGIEIPRLIRQVLVGPSDFPHVIRDAIHLRLQAAGLENPSEIIRVTGIPLRPNQR